MKVTRPRSSAHGGPTGDEDSRLPSLPRLLGALVGLLLVLGALAGGVVVAIGTAAHRALEPTTTADGSTCNTFSGECVRLSPSAVEQTTGIALPRGAQIVSSGSRSAFKYSEAWAVACVADTSGLVDQAERQGFTRAAPSAYPARHDWSGRGPSVLEVRRDMASEGEQWLEVGSTCSAGSYVYLGHYLDK